MEIDEGKRLAHPDPGDEIVISGMAGRFPESDNISQYFENICAKKDMVTDDNRRWLPTNPEIPHRSGKINFVEKMDAGYFGVHHYRANQKDPMIRQLLERTYEAFLDAGLNVNEVRGSRTGVFVGACFSETEEAVLYGELRSPNLGILGTNRSMFAQTISYHFGLQGPSASVDTACSSSLYALENAYRAIRQGKCESALVGGAGLCLEPQASLQFNRLGVLSMDGSCKAFDESANGYARSETVAVVLLQKVKHARRVYAHLVHVKTNCDGFKEQGITFPSSQMQQVLIEDAYKDCGINPTAVDFLEAHATGTHVGDPEEMTAMDRVFCVGRKSPLLIGSIKSYLGHAEGASGMCSLIKAVLGMENNCILPNINFKTPKQSIKGLIEGRMAVVTETMPWPENGSGVVAVNSFGFGGSNAHAVLKRFQKVKIDQGLPRDDLPRLVCISGRTEKGLVRIFDDISKRKLDVEYIRMLHEVFKDICTEHPFRGYIIQSKDGEISRKISSYDGTKTYLCLVLSSPNEDLFSIGQQLINIHEFARTIDRIDATLPVKTSKFLRNSALPSAKDLVVCSVAIQIGLVDLFKAAGVFFDLVLGTSIGQLAADYANQKLSLEEAILGAYHVSPKSNLDDFHRSMHPNGAIVTIGNDDDVSPNGFLHLKILRANTIESLLSVLGSIYIMGQSLHCERLYPEVQWPVGVRTPMISCLIDWNHEEDWFAHIHAKKKTVPLGIRQLTLLNKEIDWSFLPGHAIDGMVLMPATGYLYMVWETFCRMYDYALTESTIVFEDVKFLQASQISETMLFKITLARATHTFEVSDKNQLLVSGKIYSLDGIGDEFVVPFDAVPTDTGSISLTTKDFYKELKLRGYNYSGAFCAVQKSDLSGKTSWIKWKKNWIAFMDNMLQTKLLQEDTRNLYVPIYIKRLVLNASKHLNYGTKFGDDAVLPVHNQKSADNIVGGGIEIVGLLASPIPRRKARGEPVLESYKFVPFVVDLPIEEAVRVFTQIFLEDSLSLKVRVAELVDDNTKELLVFAIQRSLDEQPLIKTDISVYSRQPVDLPNIKVIGKNFAGDNQYSIVVISGIAKEPQKFLKDYAPWIKENSIVIARDTLNVYFPSLPGFEILSEITTDSEKLVLLKKMPLPMPIGRKILKVSLDGSDFSWIPSVQDAVKNGNRVVLLVENEVYSGALGFINCLRREPGGDNVQCVLIMDGDVRFQASDEFFAGQLRKNLAINVLQHGKWGTYRHLPLNTNVTVEREHVFNLITQVGNLSSLQWVEGPLGSNSVSEPESTLIRVYYSAMNFKDLTIASGRITADAFTRHRLEQIQALAQGFEYSGIDERYTVARSTVAYDWQLNSYDPMPQGRRIMGMISDGGSMSTIIKGDPSSTVIIPDRWTMEEAATVPVTYSTVLYGLVFLAMIKRNQSILIHAGSGGIGQAALNIATYFNCKIFTTVSNEEKRQFILAHFPNVPASHIGNSRDTSFETMINKHTDGRGVDIVLNSLVEEKQQASLRCLAPRGKFVEIGKYDLLKNNVASLASLTEGRSFHGVMLDLSLTCVPCVRVALVKLLNTYIELGAVKPLHRVVFNYDEVEQAYRFMAAGKHIGKILIRIREENKPSPTLYTGSPRFYCDPYSSYVVIGGLGGFGLELVDWLIIRGGRKLILVSRNGVKDGYAASRLKVWKSYQVRVDVSTDDVATHEGCISLIAKATKLGPIAGVFNLAAVIQDKLFESQDLDSFTTSLAPKAVITRQLDLVTRQMCPSLRHFVVFSSVSCGRGNPGQTNYGMANSIMERICETRKRDGCPALAIQWGAIGEVGLVAEMQELQRDIEIGGTLQQRVASCLDVLDTFLTQDEPVVASMVVAEKRSSADGAAGVINVIKNVMGITNLKTVSEHTMFSELGMDSMSGLEIKQTLERECELFLNPKEIRTLTFAKLKEMLDNKMRETEPGNAKRKLDILYRFEVNEEETKIPVKRLCSLVEKNEEAPTVILLPGIEGISTIMEPLASNLKAHTYCLQYVYDSIQEDSVESLAESLLPYVPAHETFRIVAYSYGCIIALHLVSLLEARGQKGVLVLIDGALDMFKEVTKQQHPGAESAQVLETAILSNFLQLFMPVENVIGHTEILFKFASLQERIDYTIKLTQKDVSYSKEYQEIACYKACSRMRSLFTYQPSHEKVCSTVVLFKPTEPSIENFDDDYRLQKWCQNPIKTQVAEGNHITILKNVDLANTINHLITVAE